MYLYKIGFIGITLYLNKCFHINKPYIYIIIKLFHFTPKYLQLLLITLKITNENEVMYLLIVTLQKSEPVLILSM